MYARQVPRLVTQHEGDGNATSNATGSGGDGFIPGALDWLGAAEHLWVLRLVITILLLFGAVLVGRLAKAALDRHARRTAAKQNLDPWKTRALISRTKPLSIVIHLTLFTALFITILYVWGLRTAFLSLLTAAGFAGIIIGMAAANTLSNLIAGFIIFYNHPFDIGDWVEIEGHQGLIMDVMAGATVLETWDGEKVTFPNRLVEGAMVKNFSHQRKLRRRFLVGVDYATDISKARDILLTIAKGHPEILAEPEPQVIGVEFGESSINLELRYWIAPLRARVVLIQTWIMEEVQRAFAREGIVIPFPQRTMVWRYQEGNPPPGQTVSELAYDPAKDTRPIPGPPLPDPMDISSTHQKQTRSPLWWFGRREGESSEAPEKRASQRHPVPEEQVGKKDTPTDERT